MCVCVVCAWVSYFVCEITKVVCSVTGSEWIVQLCNALWKYRTAN